MIRIPDDAIKCLDKGFVRLVDSMGGDDAIVQAARVSYGKGTSKVSQDRGLIRYLMRHRHTTPFEMVEFKFHCKMPIFVARQWVRHRTANINEYSGRYSIMSDEFYLPAEKDVHEQSKQNNQGRGTELDEDNKQLVLGRMYDVNEHAKGCYRQISQPNDLDGFYEGFKGIARELARVILPVSNYTECIWKIDLNNFFKYCNLRMDSHTQQETRDYAEAMYELVEPKFPICCEAFDDSMFNSVTFSQNEMKIIKDNLNGSWVMSKYGLSERESKEFLEKLKGVE